MVSAVKMAALLSEFARTLATDFSSHNILERLAVSVADLLPVSGVGVTLISVGSAPRYVAASDSDALQFEQLQSALDEGPCQLAVSTGKPVLIPDLAAEVRFPNFGPAAAAHGLAATFTFPLNAVDEPIGALDLYRDTTGSLNRSQLTAAQTFADVAAAYLVNARSRDAARSAAEQFRHIALHDPLTGLPNRALLAQRLAHAAKRARRSRTNAAVLFADLDRFKYVNDTYGHHVGDLLLTAVAERLMSVVRPGDTLARLYGDGFIILCEDIASVPDVEALIQRIQTSIDEPFELDHNTICTSASVGMAFAGPGVDISEQLIDQADSAMYEAKQADVDRRIIDLRQSTRQAHPRSSLQRELPKALANGELSLAYQPIVRIGDGTAAGAEALLRWHHPERGPIPALSIIGAAESCGHIRQLGTWVLEAACTAHREWRRQYPDQQIDLSVNVSANQLLDPDFSAKSPAYLRAPP